MKSILSDFEPDMCCGCGACINACPKHALSFSKDQYGFIIPRIDEDKCIDCGKCIKSCPYNSIKNEQHSHHVYAVVNKDSNMLLNSSSGGVFGAIATKMLNQGAVVFGSCMDQGFQVKHISVDCLEKLPQIQRSKYVQSYIGYTYQQTLDFLKKDRKVVFSGTPCIIAGLKSYLGKFSDSNLLITIDVVCHGIPSQDLFNDYLKVLNKKTKSPILNYTFRAKKRAKNGMEWNFSYETKDGKYYRNWPEDSYNFYYMKGSIYRDSCYKCPFASNIRYSDITLCDFWKWDSFNLPFNSDDSVSGVIINTEKGANLFSLIKDSFICEESSFDDLAKNNKCLYAPVPLNSNRDFLLNLWKKEGYDSIQKEFENKYKKHTIKYVIMRNLPPSIIYYVHKLLKKI